MVSRRGFLTGILALGAAPAIVRAESLMRIWVPPQEMVIGYDLSSAVGGDLSCVVKARRLADGTLEIINIDYMTKQMSERMRLVQETIAYGALVKYHG